MFMKKILLMILISSCAALYAASWDPAFDITVMYDGTAYSRSIDSSGTLRSSAGASARVELLTVTIGQHRIAMPMSIGVLSQSNEEGRTMIQPRSVMRLGIEYGAAISSLFSFSASIDTIYEYFLRSAAGHWLLGATITPEFSTGSIVSVTLPVSLSFGKGTFSFSLGAGARIRL